MRPKKPFTYFEVLHLDVDSRELMCNISLVYVIKSSEMS